MKFEMPSMIIVSAEAANNAMGPECCSTKWSGCCYKE